MPKVSLYAIIKDEVDTKARQFIETVLKPMNVQQPLKDETFNYHLLIILIPRQSNSHPRNSPPTTPKFLASRLN